MPKLLATYTLAILLAVCASSRLQADMVSYTADIFGFDAPGSVEIPLPLFDASMGALTEVAFDIQGDGIVVFDVANDPMGDGGYADAFLFGEFTAMVGNGPIGNTVEFFGGEEYDGIGSFGAVVSGGSGDFSNDPDVVTLFIAETAGELFSTEIFFDGFDAFPNDDDDVFATQGVFDGGQITVTYTFSPVPEPSSLIVLAMFSLGLCQSRRRASVHSS